MEPAHPVFALRLAPWVGFFHEKRLPLSPKPHFTLPTNTFTHPSSLLSVLIAILVAIRILVTVDGPDSGRVCVSVIVG